MRRFGIILVAGLAVTALAESGQAETPAGIDFKSMPVGCQWTRKLSNGQVWIEQFVGRKGNHYVIRAVNAKDPSQLVSTTEFDADGHRTRLNWANGSWSTFTPRSCFAVVGNCTYTYANSDGTQQTIESVVTRTGNTLTTQSSSGGDNFPVEHTVLGPFNIWISNKSDSYSTKVTGFQNCGAAASS